MLLLALGEEDQGSAMLPEAERRFSDCVEFKSCFEYLYELRILPGAGLLWMNSRDIILRQFRRTSRGALSNKNSPGRAISGILTRFIASKWEFRISFLSIYHDHLLRHKR